MYTSKDQSEIMPNIPDPDIPPIVLREMKKTWHKYRKRIAHSTESKRLDGFFESMFSNGRIRSSSNQQPILALCPDLTAKPFWDFYDDLELENVGNKITSYFKDIQAEYYQQAADKNLNDYDATYRYESLDHGDWTGYIIGSYEGINRKAQRLFPKTCELVRMLQPYLIGRVEFLKLRPGITIPPHTDSSNIQLTWQLGIHVESNCAIQVANETRDIQEGKLVIFDHSFIHSAWNHGKQDRVVLLFDMKHPELTEQEMTIYRHYHKILKYSMLKVYPVLAAKKLYSDTISRFLKRST
ncbi:MAG: aspartyl/asparaginyl beta-hydroxylase domain-containing protein [Gammaproteobacteria bacterium]|nr:aspartyl/asparaginyl beta-hydroxylase domain-containing protein [Gammaproteobacteria bacterium]